MEKNTAENTSILSGVKPVHELIATSPELIDTVYVRRGARGDAAAIVDAARAAHVRFKLVDPHELSRLTRQTDDAACGTGSDDPVRHQGVVARLCSSPGIGWTDLLTRAADAPLPLIIMADHILDPGNLGTIVRTLYALGGAGLVVPKDRSAYLGPIARRAAAGAMERLPIARVTNLGRSLDEAAKTGFTIYGAAWEPGKSRNLYATEVRLPAVLVLGGEEAGIREHVAKRCDVLLHIPMHRDFDSLNVAQAGAICIAEFAHRHFNLSEEQ